MRIWIGKLLNNAGCSKMLLCTLLTPGAVPAFSFQKCPGRSNRKKGAGPGLATIANAELRFRSRVLTRVKGLPDERGMLSGVLVLHIGI